MGQERRTANTSIKGSRFTSGQRMVLEWAVYMPMERESRKPERAEPRQTGNYARQEPPD